MQKRFCIDNLFTYVFASFAVLCLAWVFLTSAPGDFPKGRVVTIGQGETLSELSSQLKADHYIRFAHIFKAIMIVSGEQHTIQQGDYLLDSPVSAFDLAWRIAHGQYGIPLVRVTVPEGSTNAQIAGIIDSLPQLRPGMSDFLMLAANKQGYLFPDTYFFAEGTNAQNVIDAMQENFNKKIASLQPAMIVFAESTTTAAITTGMKPPISEWTPAQLQSDAVIMASILEKEAATDTDRRIIAGILWKRLALGMLLEVNSATSTYTQKGLPAAPICNPGLDSLTDALTPDATAYFYYLSDKQGTIHYAQTFAEHQANIAKYL